VRDEENLLNDIVDGGIVDAEPPCLPPNEFDVAPVEILERSDGRLGGSFCDRFVASPMGRSHGANQRPKERERFASALGWASWNFIPSTERSGSAP
jgi:hypothetical protein